MMTWCRKKKKKKKPNGAIALTEFLTRMTPGWLGSRPEANIGLGSTTRALPRSVAAWCNRRRGGLRRAACTSPNGREPRRQPHGRAGRAQAAAAPRISASGSPQIRPMKGREAETVECAGGGLLLLSRGPRGSKRQMQKFAGGSRAI